MSTGFTRIDTRRFGPWALVTGASSGIGREFARQLAANGINLVLAARRLPVLETLGRELSSQYGISYRAVRVDLTDAEFLSTITHVTGDLDIGLLVSNAGDAIVDEFLAAGQDALLDEMRLNAVAHLELSHHLGRRLVRRERGGILFVSSIAGLQGAPYQASYSAAKGYLANLGEAIHRELAPYGVHVTVLLPGPTDTEALTRFAEMTGFDLRHSAMGRMFMPVGKCAAEGLAALQANRATRIPGMANRLLSRLMPRGTRVRVVNAMNKSLFDKVQRAREAGHEVPVPGLSGSRSFPCPRGGRWIRRAGGGYAGRWCFRRQRAAQPRPRLKARPGRRRGG